MLEVSVSLYGYIRDVVPEGKVRLTLPAEATVGSLLVHLGQSLGERFRERVFTENGELLPSVRVMVGGVLVESLEESLARGEHTEIAVVIVPPVIGGR